MKAAMEGLLYSARVDIVFSGHVHAYERFVSPRPQRQVLAGFRTPLVLLLCLYMALFQLSLSAIRLITNLQ